MTTQKPSLGRVVLVTVDPTRNNGSDTAPATIVRVWSDTMVNVKVHLDGNDDLWLTSLSLHADRQALDTRAVKWRADLIAAGHKPETVRSYIGAFWPPRTTSGTTDDTARASHLGQVAYEAYSRAVSGVSVLNDALPTYEEMRKRSPKVAEAWNRAGEAVGLLFTTRA